MKMIERSWYVVKVRNEYRSMDKEEYEKYKKEKEKENVKEKKDKKYMGH